MQFFGEVEIDAKGELAVTLRDLTGSSLHRQVLTAQRV
jgi:hypothetical protein